MDRLSDKANDPENCFLLIKDHDEYIPDLALELVEGKKLTILKMQWVYDCITSYQLINTVDYVVQTNTADEAVVGSRTKRRRTSKYAYTRSNDSRRNNCVA